MVSIRARSIERAIRADLRRVDLSDAVSIRARSIERAIRHGSSCYVGALRFQSAPARLSGRYNLAGADLSRVDLFQSAPARLSGRYVGDGDAGVVVICFNPRPLD